MMSRLSPTKTRMDVLRQLRQVLEVSLVRGLPPFILTGLAVTAAGSFVTAAVDCSAAYIEKVDLDTLQIACPAKGHIIRLLHLGCVQPWVPWTLTDSVVLLEIGKGR